MPDTAPQSPDVAPAPSQTSSTTEILTPSSTQAAQADTSSADAPSLLNETKPTEPKAEAPKGAPEKYADFKAPEGFDLDPGAVGKFSELAKGLNLSQDQAQSLVDFYAEQNKEAFDAPFKLWRETQENWVKQIRADPEIGGKLDQVKTTVARAIDGLGDPKLAADFRQAMDYTGAGNNPAFVRAFYKLAQMVTEGSAVVAPGPPQSTGRRPTLAEAMYGPSGPSNTLGQQS